MELGFVLLYCATSAIGFAALFLNTALYVRDRDRLTAHYLAFTLMYGTAVMFQAVSYFHTPDPVLDRFLQAKNFLYYPFFTYAFPAVFFQFTNVALTSAKRRLLLASASVVLSFLVLTVVFPADAPLFTNLAALAVNTVLVGSIVLGLLNLGKVRARTRKVFTLVMLALIAVLIVVTAIGDFLVEKKLFQPNLDIVSLTLNAIFFILWNAADLAYLFIEHFLVPVRPSLEGPDREFCDRYDLSPREREILEWMLRGKKNKEIADALFISVRTVETHLQHIYGKTGTAGRLELFRLAADEASGHHQTNHRG